MQPHTHSTARTDARNAPPPSLTPEVAQDQLSALMDGELAPAECDALLLHMGHPAASAAQPGAQPLLADWECYQVIGQCLRTPTQHHVAPNAPAFLARLRDRLADEPAMAPASTIGLQPAPALAPVAPAGEAANASVFRWKMVAGFASVAAVAAIGWNSLAGFSGANPASSMQLAAGSAETPSAAATAPAVQTVMAASAPPGPIRVATQGAAPDGASEVLIRDPKLDELLARQYGNTLTLQPPAPFLRNASMAGSGQH